MGLIPEWGRSPGGGNGSSLLVPLLGEWRGWRSLEGCSPWGCKERGRACHIHPGKMHDCPMYADTGLTDGGGSNESDRTVSFKGMGWGRQATTVQGEGDWVK